MLLFGHRSVRAATSRPPRPPGAAAFAATLLLLVLGLSACDTTEPALFEEEYVVESYQIAGEELQPVRLSRTLPLDVQYNATRAGVRDARVEVQLLASDGAVERTFGYTEHPQQPGLYLPVELERVEPLRRYRLDVRFADSPDRVTAETVVPDTFRVISVNADTVVYQSTEQLELLLTPSRYPGRQSVFIFRTEALAPREDLLTPFARQIYEDGDGEVTLEDLSNTGSGLLNEALFAHHADGTITIEYPWLAVTFYGPNRISALALDDNAYDFVRSQSVQRGGSTLPPGEIPNVIEHVEGGTGLFGSYARTTVDIFIKRAPTTPR